MAEQDPNKPYLTQPTTVTDLERRYAEEAEGKKVEVVNPTPYAVEDNDVSMYAGVSEEYATYADERQKPYAAEDGPEAEAEARIRGAEYGQTTVQQPKKVTFHDGEDEVVDGVRPSSKAVGGLAQVGPHTLGLTANEPVAAVVQPSFDAPAGAEAEGDGDTPVASTEGAGGDADPQAQAGGGGTDTTEAAPAPAAPKKAPGRSNTGGDNDKQGAGKD